MSAHNARRARIHGKVKRGQRWRHRSATLASSALILKDLYPKPGGYRLGWWARLAYERGWVTFDEYYALPRTEKVPDLYPRFYGKSAFFSLLPKSDADAW